MGAIIDISQARCLTCKFFDYDGKSQTGDCHRFPPTAMFLGGDAGIRVTFYPSPNPGMWCGEHQPKIEMAGAEALPPGNGRVVATP